MSMLVWVMMGIAIWHFAVFVPDRFWGGIVGAFLAAIVGAVVFGLIVAGFSIPGRNDTELVAGADRDTRRGARAWRVCLRLRVSERRSIGRAPQVFLRRRAPV